jgi:glycosyltransferase involved in cell wall biosynthesis
MESPFVSVVIPTYYRNTELREVIESVVQQDYNNLEISVVDDSGERHAEPVVSDFSGVDYIPLEENKGAQAARTEGIRHCTGEYIQLLDDDDRLHPSKISKQVDALTRNPDIGVVYCGVEWENGHTVLPDPDVRGDVLKQALQFNTAPCITSTMLIDADILRSVLPLKDRPGADDIGMKIELARRTQFDFVDAPLLIKGASEDSRGSSAGSYEGRFAIMEEYADLYEEFPGSVRRQAAAYTYIKKAQVELDNKVWSTAAIVAAFKTCYFMPTFPFIGYFFASLFGRPGRDLARQVYQSVFLDESHTGKIA